MMLRRRSEPVFLWGLEPCEGILPSSHISVTAGGAVTRRTPPGRGAASSRSNVADLSLLSNGRQFWREREHCDDKETTSSAAAPSPVKPTEMAFQGHYLSGATCGIPVSVLRQGMSATSKVALGEHHA